ncbi:MAG TPA: homocysteine S-methyltransferase family protein [Bacillota bacterium]|nr:homocysteine S-methyltransferase family protein [Bacillota bacterium]
MNFEECFHTFKFILMEGALSERLKREFHINSNNRIGLAEHIYNHQASQILLLLFKQYIDIAEKFDLPIMLTTPTRRANQERVLSSPYKNNNVIWDNVEHLMKLKKETSTSVYIGGLMGCKGDAYSITEVLSIDQALKFHSWQTDLFAQAKVDFLYAGIMPALSEAIGMAKAMELTGLPYIISFMIRQDGKLIDGATINDAIEAIDSNTTHRPLCYMTNCVHPQVLHRALSCEFNKTDVVKKRFKGIQANTSSLSPEELDLCCDLKTSDSICLSEDMMKLYQDFELKIFGGCCGTNNTHIEEIAKKLDLIIHPETF